MTLISEQGYKFQCITPLSFAAQAPSIAAARQIRFHITTAEALFKRLHGVHRESRGRLPFGVEIERYMWR